MVAVAAQRSWWSRVAEVYEAYRLENKNRSPDAFPDG